MVIVIVVLFAVSAAAGFLLGYFCFHWFFIVASGLIIALTTAWILQANGIWVVAGIAAIVACLTINQFAFLVGGMARKGEKPRARSDLSSDCGDDEPRSYRHKRIDCDDGDH